MSSIKLMGFLFTLLAVLLVTNACSDRQVRSEDNSAGYIRVLGDPSQKQVSPDYQITFPNDHGSHDDYSIEWWYFTTILYDEQQQYYAVQWTLFRFLDNSEQSSWANNQRFMAHAKLSTFDEHLFEERFARGGVGNAGVELDPYFIAFLDEWTWQGHTPDLLPAELTFSIENQAGKAELALTLSTQRPYSLHGNAGYSQKLANAEHASMYYSQPFIEASGTIVLNGKTIKVKGRGWFDHEWSGQLSDQGTQGWNWFSLHLSNGSKLMLFEMRHETKGSYWSGSLISSDGQVENLNPKQISADVLKYTDIQQRQLPLHWKIAIPHRNISLQIEPMKEDQWNGGIFSYYEGAIKATGSHTAEGFLEITGN